MIRLSTALALTALALTLLLGGCGDLPRTYFYTLRPAAGATPGTPLAAPAAPPAPTPSQSQTGGYQVLIGPVAIPEYVDRPQLVLRLNASEQRLMEQRMWVQPLGSEIDSALRDDLSHLLPGSVITTLGQSAASTAQYRVAIDVQRFDSELGKEAQFSARWTLRDRSGRQVDTGELAVREPVHGPGYDALVAAHAAAVGQLAQQIADALRRQPVQAGETAATAQGAR